MNRVRIRCLTESAVMASLSVILSFITIFRMPQGGYGYSRGDVAGGTYGFAAWKKLGDSYRCDVGYDTADTYGRCGTPVINFT